MLAQLSAFEIFYGSFTIASVIISTILGLFIALKFIKHRKVELLLVGITWILLASPYWSDAIQFIIVMLYEIELNPPLYFFLANAFIAPIHITWSIAFTNFLFKKQQKKILIFFGIEAITFELAFLIVFPSIEILHFLYNSVSTFQLLCRCDAFEIVLFFQLLDVEL